MKTQWYKVTYSDGSVQYATECRELYYIDGSGFGCSFSSDVTIEPIDEVPTRWKKTKVGFDFGKWSIDAVVDCNRHWNGWECPYIFAKDAKKLVRRMNNPIDGETWKLKRDGTIVVINDWCSSVDEYKPFIHPFNGELMYDFGGCYTWEQK